MENGEILLTLLNSVEKNGRQAELLRFVETLALHLEVGYDLAFAWNESVASLKTQPSRLAAELEATGPLTAQLEKLARSASVDEAKVWFSLLVTLYQEGSPILGAVTAFRRQLNADTETAIARHGEEFPVKASLALLFFFLPPAFVLIFYPLIQQWLRALSD